MKNILRRILLFLLKRLKVRYDLYRQINGEWIYFTYAIDNRNLKEGDRLNDIVFDGEAKSYSVLHRIKIYNAYNLALFVEEDKTIQPKKVIEEPVEYNTIERMKNYFKNRFSKKK